MTNDPSARRFWLGLTGVMVGLFGWPLAVLAVGPNPLPFEAHQPDGTRVTLRMRGTERDYWYEDSKGFSVVTSGGRFVYATLDATGHLAATNLVVGASDPVMANLTVGIKPTAAAPVVAAAAAAPRIPTTPAKGIVKNLVILCLFKDHAAHRADFTRPREDYEKLFNSPGADPQVAPTGSVRDVYTENSYGAVTLKSTVVGWVTLPHDEAYYTGGNSGIGTNDRPVDPVHNARTMITDALVEADKVVDFAQFDTGDKGFVDAIDIIHSGYGAEAGGPDATWQDDRIWSHQWTLEQPWSSADKNGKGENVKVQIYHTEPALWGSEGTGITRIGVIAHETGHFFGLPDLYDHHYQGQGAGSWCLMANSWGLDGTQLHPPHFSAWAKIQLGWLTPTLIGQDGTYSLHEVEEKGEVFKITKGFPEGEYLLVENRQPAGFDADIPQGGLAIWHIDESKAEINNDDLGFPGQTNWPANNHHYRVALLQADSRYDLERCAGGCDPGNLGDEGDLYRAGNVLNAATFPNSNAYQDGKLSLTHNSIASISGPGVVMTFAYSSSPMNSVSALTKALADRRPTVRVAAAEGLLQLRPASDEACRPLLDAMGDADEGGRQRARQAVARLGSSIVPRLARELTEGPNKAQAAEALGETGAASAASAASALADAVGRESTPAAVRVRSAYALRRIRADSPEVVSSLVKGIKSGDAELRSASLGALGAIGAGAKGAVPEVARLLSSEASSDVKLAAANALGKIGPDAHGAVAELSGLYTQLKQSKSGSGTGGLSTSIALTSIDPGTYTQQASKEIGAALTSASAPELRHSAIEAVSRMDAGRAREFSGRLKALLPNLTGNDRDLAVALLFASTPEDADLRQQLMRDLDKDLALLAGAAGSPNATGDHGDVASVTLVRAIGLLGADAKRAVPVLKALSNNKAKGEVSSAATEALRRIEGHE